MVGDFNAVKNVTEKFGKVAYRMNMEMVEFIDFIDHMDLIDMSTIGNTLYWSNAVGGIASRINRLLVLEGPIEAWNIVGQEIGARDISNHRPVWTKSSNLNWGLKPFKVIRGWLTHDKFIDFVKSEWDSLNIAGKKAYIIKEKFKLLRERIRW